MISNLSESTPNKSPQLVVPQVVKLDHWGSHVLPLPCTEDPERWRTTLLAMVAMEGGKTPQIYLIGGFNPKNMSSSDWIIIPTYLGK
jgi:hypothetical protein